MKIREFGQGSGHSGDRFRGSRRAHAFRDRHRIGDRLHGIVLTRPENGLAWIEIQGYELLAEIKTDALPGQQLLFIVLRLLPEIVLQEITDPSCELSRQVPRFLSARSRFESCLESNEPLDAHAPKDFQHRKRLFHQWLRREPERRERYSAIGKLQGDINDILDQNHPGDHFFYLPWLFPGGRETEALVSSGQRDIGHPDAAREILLRFRVTGLGAALVNIVLRASTISYQAALEHPEDLPLLDSLLRGWTFEDRYTEFACMGATVLNSDQNTSILTGLLKRGVPGTGLDLRV